MPAALLIDIKNSRKYDTVSRNKIQEYLINLKDYMNWVFKSSIAQDLQFSAGDGIQGLFNEIGAAYICLRWFSRLAAPIKIHAGIGVGEWSTRISNLDTNYQDGSAYHNAREAIDKAKKETDYMALVVSKSEMDPYWNAIMNAGFQLVKKNTAKQNELAILFELLCPIGEDYIQPPNINYLHDLIQQKNELSAVLKNAKKVTNNSFPSMIPNEYEYYIGKMREFASYSKNNNNYRKDDKEIIYSRSHPFGTASLIAMMTERVKKDKRPGSQSVDITLKASNVYAERAIALALIEETKR